MTASEFAEKMGVSYFTITRWLRLEIVPGATRTWNSRWEIPESALDMVRPRTGPALRGDIIVRIRSESRLIMNLQTELKDLNERHTKLVEKHVGLQGRYDGLEAKHEHDKKYILQLESQLKAINAAKELPKRRG